MNNILNFYYDLYADNINKINNNYYFTNKENNYVFHIYNRSIEEIGEIYEINNELNKMNYPSYKIILTKFNSILVEYDNNLYVLMIIPNIKNRIINISDILKFNIEINKEYKYIDKSDWGRLWSEKIDYIEYQFYQIETKYKKISNNINFFIGLWENAISYFNEKTNISNKKNLCIRRVETNTDLLSLLNPVEFIIDNKERMIGDYLKSYVINEKYTNEQIINILNSLSLNKEKIIILESRILFPSYYFDIYENIIEKKLEEENIKKIEIKYKNIIKLINLIQNKYQNYNIPIIYWIKKEEDHSPS